MKKFLSILLILALSVSIFAGCTSSAPPSDTSGGSTQPSTSGSETPSGATDTPAPSGGDKELVVSLYAELGKLDPHATSAAWDSMVISNIHDPLLRTDQNGQIFGALAEEWNVSEDGLTYTFKLRDGVTFQNGTPLKASDVKFSLERAMENASSRRNVAFIDSVEVVSDNEVIVHAKAPSAGGLKYLASANTCILSEEYVNEVGEDYTNKPMGTGPFEMVEFISGDRIILKANPNYYMGKAPIDSLVIRTIKESTTAMIALETGEVDVVINVPEMDKRNIENTAGLNVEETSAAIFWTLLMNTQQDPFKDKRVRQAIYMAIDPQEVIDVVVDGAGTVAECPLHPMTNGYVDTVKRWPYDLEKAKELLADAGYPDGFSCTISVREDFTQKTAQVIQSQLAKIGITVDINVMQFSAWLDDAIQGKHEIWPMGFQDIILDCELPLSQLHSSGLGSTNYTQFSSPEFDALHDALLKEVDPAKRTELITQILEFEKEEAVRVPMYFQMNNIAFQDSVTGAYVLPNSNYFFYYFDKE